MNWIQGLQRAIDYVEANLAGEIDMEEAAKQAYASPFHFRRVFGILCGYSLGDYIRMRRLSLAGEELAGGGARVIDVALKYGYDTPESFPEPLPDSTALPPARLSAADGSRASRPCL